MFLGANDLKSGDHVPVVASGIVVKLSDRIPRRQALDTPLFGRDALVAGYDKRLGVRGYSHSTRDGHIAYKNVYRKCRPAGGGYARTHHPQPLMVST